MEPRQRPRLRVEVRSSRVTIIIRDSLTGQILAVIPSHSEQLRVGSYTDPASIVRILVHIASKGSAKRMPADVESVYRVIESIFLNPQLQPEERVKLAMEAVRGLRRYMG